MGRIYPIDGDVKTLFVNNGKFNTRNTKFLGERTVTAEGVTHQQPSIDFPQLRDKGEFRAKGHYRTIFGPAVYLPVNVLATNDHNQSYGLLRILNVPKLCPEVKKTLEPEEYLDAMQEQYVQLRDNQAEAMILQDNLKILAERFASCMQEYDGLEDEIKWRILLPHQKKDLRILGKNEIDLDGLTGCPRRWHRKTWYKCKADELAKWNKVIRMIGDLGINASLAGFIITEFLKSSMCKPMYFKNRRDEVVLKVVFTKQPTVDVMQACFDDMINPQCKGVFYYHSDDSILALRTPNGIKRYNIDISSCDASHTTALFELLQELVPGEAKEEISTLIEQCTKIFEIRSYTSRSKCKLKPQEPVLPSGSTLTTLINNIACVVAANQMALRDVETEEEIRFAWKKAGYIVTLSEAKKIEEVQFLKTSPCEDIYGVYRPLLNLGVFLRATGRCKGDLPGHGDILERAKIFQASLIQGMFPRTKIPMIESLRVKFPLKERFEHEMEYKFQDDVGFSFTNASVFKRYGIRGDDVEQWFETCETETYFDSEGVRRILEVDYEYKY